MTPSVRPVRWVITVGGLTFLLVLAAALLLGRWYGRREAARAAAEHVARVLDVESKLERAETRASTTAAALAEASERAKAAGERAAQAEIELVDARAARARVVEEVRRPVPPEERARRVRTAIAAAAPEIGTSTASVVPDQHGARIGFFVERPHFTFLEEQLRLRIAADGELVKAYAAKEAQAERADAEHTRAERAIERSDALELQVAVLRPAWADAEGRAAEAQTQRGPSTMEYVIAGVVVVAAFFGGVGVGHATAGGPDVTVVTP